MGCISTLSQPRFTPAERFGLSVLPLPFKQPHSTLSDELRHILELGTFDENLTEILAELEHMTSALNNTAMNLPMIHRTITPIQFHLLSIQSAGYVNSENSALQELCCIGALVYLKTVYDYHLCLQFRGRAAGALMDGAMVQKMKSCLDIADSNTAPTRTLFLAVIFLAGAAVGGTKDRVWFVARLAKAIMELQICSWEDAKSSLATFLWVDKIHEIPCRELWEEALTTVDVLFGGGY